MSEIFDITVEVRGFAARRAAEVVDAIRTVLAAEGQTETFSPVERGIIDGERVLRVRGDQVEGSFEWLETFESALETAVDEANGSPCQLLLFSATGIDELDAPEGAGPTVGDFEAYPVPRALAVPASVSCASCHERFEVFECLECDPAGEVRSRCESCHAEVVHDRVLGP